MKVSVIIKALNEGSNIARTIESALEAVRNLPGGGEVILADSLSTDRTVEIAAGYPIRIVQLADPTDRCCGVGAELGYRVARGEHLYVLDGDMELVAGFLEAAIAALDADHDLVGVGGTVHEMNVVNAEFRGRAARPPAHMSPGLVDRLNMGGLYRRSAIDAAGYLTNRNLHAFEEYELAIRLRENGGRLIRLDILAVRHYGHTDESFSLLLRRWRSRYAWALGELFRELGGGRRMFAAMREIRLFQSVLLVWIWWACAALSLTGAVLGWWAAWVPLVIGLGPLFAAALRRKSFTDGVYVVAFLSVLAAGTLAGWLGSRRGAPQAAVAMRVIS